MWAATRQLPASASVSATCGVRRPVPVAESRQTEAHSVALYASLRAHLVEGRTARQASAAHGAYTEGRSAPCSPLPHSALGRPAYI